jgi:hypothetical protein
MNLGLKDKLKAEFPNIYPVDRPIVSHSLVKFDPNWIAGFATGEGCFYIKISKTLNTKAGYSVQVVFQITQHNRDERLL